MDWGSTLWLVFSVQPSDSSVDSQFFLIGSKLHFIEDILEYGWPRKFQRNLNLIAVMWEYDSVTIPQLLLVLEYCNISIARWQHRTAIDNTNPTLVNGSKWNPISCKIMDFISIHMLYRRSCLLCSCAKLFPKPTIKFLYILSILYIKNLIVIVSILYN